MKTKRKSKSLALMKRLSNLTSPAAVKAAIAEYDSYNDPREFLSLYGYDFSKSYYLEYAGRQYDSKAVAAVALSYQYGGSVLDSNDCYGGRGSGRAGTVLSNLGFVVKGIKSRGWLLSEIEPTIDAYFEMMDLTRAKTPFKKSDKINELYKLNKRRTRKSYEYKFQNISAALEQLKKPWLNGYAPKKRFQKLLLYSLVDRLAPNKRQPISPLPSPKIQSRINIRKIDWALRDAKNRALGLSGEKFVVRFERKRLIGLGLNALARKVKRLSAAGDGHGYDISSFDKNGKPIHIEVKTTNHSASTPFFVSNNELKASLLLNSTYLLYRVYNFASAPKIAISCGPLSSSFTLSASSYKARTKQSKIA
jgi:hypothetical protein